MGKNYLDLKAEVWDTGICAACGACVAVCPADAIYFKTGEESTRPFNNGYCKEVVDGVPCGACYATCPRLDPAPTEMFGKYIDIFSAKADIPIPGKQSGGAVTAILVNALEQGLIDAVVTVEEDPWTLKPSSTVITSEDALISQAGSRYNWWVPLVSSLKEAVITRKYRSVAIVGVPCVVQAVRKMLDSDHDLLRPFKRSIRLVVGLFCTETFDYEKLVEDKLIKERSIEPMDIVHFDVKGKLEITMRDGSLTVIPLKEIDECVRPGCKVCTDFTAIGSDISAGSVGSPKGYTTVIVRSSAGKAVVENAIENGLLSKGSDVDMQAIEKLSTRKLARKQEKKQ
jgi:coenzyme F420 hydrogenase subunit beta